jgi:hypothetical protein
MLLDNSCADLAGHGRKFVAGKKFKLFWQVITFFIPESASLSFVKTVEKICAKFF